MQTMNLIVSKKRLAPSIVRLEIEAPLIARKRKAGQFVILRVHENGERIPITIAGADPDKGTITLVIQEVGKTTMEAGALEPGDHLQDVAGPLGTPTHVERWGRVVCVAGGVGAAVVLPIARAFREAGNEVEVILGARSEDLIVLEDELAEAGNRLWVTTDDGSKGEKGLVLAPLERLLAGGDIALVMAAGPVPMMEAVCELTKRFGVRTLVSLNPIMVDGTGMCGGCRVSIGGAVRYACVDGPEFDGHEVDFGELRARLSMYRPFEERKRHECRLSRVPESGVAP